MAATEPLYLRLTPGLKDRIVAAARRDGVSANEWAQETLRRALASGADGSVSAGLAVSSAPVASDGALAEREPTGSEKRSTLPTSPATDSGASTAPDAVLGVSPGPTIGSVEPGSRSVSAPDPPRFAAQVFDETHTLPSLSGTDVAKKLAASVEGVSTAGDLAKKQVTPHLKSEQAGRKK